VAYAARGGVYAGKGQYERAIANFDRAIKLNAKFAVTYATRGLAFELKGEKTSYS
jgi:tetratricopeptide (TPR) repeat protein